MNKVYEVSSFTIQGQGGNLAGVKILKEEETPSDSFMQQLSQKLNYSETVFVKRLNQEVFQLRYFTPLAEVPLCGHATIAAFSLLKQLNQLEAGNYFIETKAGRLALQILDDATIYMEQSLPIFYSEQPDMRGIAESLGLESGDIVSGFPIEIVSTGLKDLIIPVKNTAILHNLVPDFDAISTISKKLAIIGYHVFAANEDWQQPIQCRNFAPFVGIDEEYATGTSNGALACYLFKKNQRKGNQKYNFLQGRQSKKQQGQILVELKAAENRIRHVYVGGKAVLKRTLSI
ncbi:PhzF family phenazine biosynthesis protein [Enterococcus rivorum]|uniref:PhzF family phenazine biosynthesis protein n=1 Tax=Enterococcus rivorum TaxID=762845 RepID=A0A1E5L0F1_9ENTE|nr:PhzF family phenazine biosynthesis protein [Enterococcus rivorum]MBP2098509.1 PhzF family phenazine biosynthesis protein [Enterococcus rivorum]OEH83642.1 PhzF family phenazine biosynthesis protein [Enterococcus rivorum]